jgi:hypothetical protein
MLLYSDVVNFFQHCHSSCEEPGHQRVWGAQCESGTTLLLVVSAEPGLGEDIVCLGDLRRLILLLARLGLYVARSGAESPYGENSVGKRCTVRDRLTDGSLWVCVHRKLSLVASYLNECFKTFLV